MKRLLPPLILLASLVPLAAAAQEADEDPPVDAPYVWPDAEWVDPDAPAMDERMARRMDWVRAGLVMGVQLGDSLHLQVGGKLSFFGLMWPNAYFYPIVQTFSFPVRGGIGPNVFSGLEAGYAYRSGGDVVLVGLAFGAGIAAYGGGDVFGAGVRPTIRYRHYWGRFGLEVSAELPLVLGRHADSGGDFRAAGYFPLFGLSVGL